MLATCVMSAACAAAFAVLLLRERSESGWPLWKLLASSLLLIPGQVLPPVMLWQAWRSMYFVIPFLGPPIRVGMAAVGWACAALVFSYIPSIAYACRRQWSWLWVLLHPCGTIRMVWRGWKSHLAKRAG